MANEWDDELLHNVGTVKSYTDRSPEAYLNDNTDFEHNAQTWDQVAHVDADEVKAEGIALARQAEHSRDSVMHRTANKLPVEVVVSTLSQQRPRQSLFQRSRGEAEEKAYDHLHEQTSTILPYTQRDHAWNNEQHDKSHEKTWKEQTQAETQGAYSPSLSQQWDQSLSQNQEKLYSVMEQNR